MKTEEMICELRRLEEAHKDDFVGTGETNWSLMCHDVANRQRKGRLHLICCSRTNILYQLDPIPADLAQKLGIEPKEG